MSNARQLVNCGGAEPNASVAARGVSAIVEPPVTSVPLATIPAVGE